MTANLFSKIFILFINKAHRLKQKMSRSKCLASDVMLVSYPKSGVSYLSFLIANIYELAICQKSNVKINYYNVDLNSTSLHAEVVAVNRLRPHHGKRPKKIHIIVLRTNNKGDRLMLAKSCESCMKYMRRELPKKGYHVQKAWYSNDEGDFTRFVV